MSVVLQRHIVDAIRVHDGVNASDIAVNVAVDVAKSPLARHCCC